MYAERHAVTITTDAEGAAEVYTPAVTGRVLGVRLVIPGSGGLDAGTDLTVTAEATGEAILAVTNQGGSSASYYPRQPIHGATGAALEYATGFAQVEPITLVADRVKIVVAQGGNVTTGTAYVIVG